jgi:glutathionylspermidine synthase
MQLGFPEVFVDELPDIPHDPVCLSVRYVGFTFHRMYNGWRFVSNELSCVIQTVIARSTQSPIAILWHLCAAAACLQPGVREKWWSQHQQLFLRCSFVSTNMELYSRLTALYYLLTPWSRVLEK